MTPATVSVPAGGGSETFTVKIAPVCAWTVTSDSAFAHPGAGRTGSGTIVVTFDVNPGPSRSATLTFPGGTVTVMQAGGAVVAPVNEEISYFHTDAIGSVRMITNAAGAVVARYDYLPFGIEWSSSFSNTPNAVKFAGKERDAETGFSVWQPLDYFGARSYQSQTGRFTRPDDPGYANPFDPQSMNLYAYARNNPLGFIDPDGHQFTMVIVGTSNEVKQRELNDNARRREWIRLQMAMFPWAADVFDQALSLVLPVTPREQANALSLSIMPIAGMSAASRAVPFMSKWGWTGSTAWRQAVRLLKQGGTLKDIGGKIPSRKEALRLLEEAGATIDRIEGGHLPPNPHTYPHINFSTASGVKGTIRIQGP